MRVKAEDGPLRIQAISGTDVVLLGMDLDEEYAEDLVGFAIGRSDHTEGQAYWLRNLLAFAVNDDGSSSYSSWDNPIQTFRWGDYTAKPDHEYTYRVRALTGTPGHLRLIHETRVTVRTESLTGGDHTVVFNRGAIASQAYADRYDNVQPDKVPNRAAYKWLSAGLEEALLAFIGQASNSRWSLRAAVYEFSYAPVLDAFALAAQSGADVDIVSDQTGGATGDPKVRNQAAIDAAGIGDLVHPRTHTGIAHNKFIVALFDGKPVSVWTGSTNVTEGGIFGQSNVGHIVRDPSLARAYLTYWEQLRGNPFQKVLKPWNDEHPVVPLKRLTRKGTGVFSPRTDLGALEWYAELAAQARSGLFLTAAFGVSKQLMSVLTSPRDYLRYVLMDTDSGGTQLMIRNADPDNRVTIGATVPKGGWGRWVREVTLDANKHVRYVHTKFMLIDPLGPKPIVITGSANFSAASTTTNDENMVVIRGNTAVADVYLTEFMRLFTHYEFRAAIAGRASATVRTAPSAGVSTGRRYLDPTSSWVPRWYVADSARAKERRLWSGA